MLAALPFPSIDPIAFQLGPLAIRWYGLAYVTGFALAYLWLKRLIARGQLRIAHDQLDTLLALLVAGVIIGGRLGWWLFYHRPTGEPEPWYEPFATWHGGMSFHGALIGVACVLFAWCARKQAPVWNVIDCAALVTPVGLFFGRIANFINGELFGRPSNLPWAVVFPGERIARHPSQLYEALLEGPLLLACLWLVRRMRPREGRIGAMFLILYGLFRFAVEFTREPDPQLGFIAFGWLTMGQILSAGIVLAGVGLYATLRRSPHISIGH